MYTFILMPPHTDRKKPLTDFLNLNSTFLFCLFICLASPQDVLPEGAINILRGGGYLKYAGGSSISANFGVGLDRFHPIWGESDPFSV